MTIFTNKSTVELIPQNEINSDFGVLLFRSASFNKFDKSKYQAPDGTHNDIAVQKIYECLIHKHRSVFFGSRIEIDMSSVADTNILCLGNFTKNELAGMEYYNEQISISIFLALKWIYEEYEGICDVQKLEKIVKMQYPACYKALKMLPKENVTQEEKDLLEEQRTKFISFKAELPIFIARQLYRHRGINYTERSGRYTAENTRFYKPDAWRKAPEKATQGSIENEFVEQNLSGSGYEYNDLITEINEWYNHNIFNGGKTCKEQARMILPQSQITTTINTVDLYTLSSILSQRLDKHAQLEIREVAQQLYDIACQEFGKELVDKLIDIQNRLIF
jgi:flavin-dependent thymidylate synthase